MGRQARLLPPSPAEQAAVLIAVCQAVLARQLTIARKGGQHLPTCGRGLWIGTHTSDDGAPCSAKCAEVQATITQCQQWLESA